MEAAFAVRKGCRGIDGSRSFDERSRRIKRLPTLASKRSLSYSRSNKLSAARLVSANGRMKSCSKSAQASAAKRHRFLPKSLRKYVFAICRNEGLVVAFTQTNRAPRSADTKKRNSKSKVKIVIASCNSRRVCIACSASPPPKRQDAFIHRPRPSPFFRFTNASRSRSIRGDIRNRNVALGRRRRTKRQ
jgi:hypothetical protein